LRIGTVDITHPLCLAPMESVSDPPFRVLCKRFGADLLWTEFANCAAIVRHVPRECRKLLIRPEERPIAIQIYGSFEESMEKAARQAEAMKPDWIDINCGCWVKKIAHRGDGAGLLRDLKKFEAVVKAVQRGTTLPVTVKTRLGWDADSIVILDVARMLENIGIAALTVHFRTRSQGYSGKADWNWIPRIKEAAPALPLIANGDISSPEDARHCLNLGADAVMIGRAAISRPWIFQQIRAFLNGQPIPPEPDLAERIRMALEHLREHTAYHGERRGVFSFRRRWTAYLHAAPGIAKLRADLMTVDTVSGIEERLACYVEDIRRYGYESQPVNGRDESLTENEPCMKHCAATCWK